MENDKDLEAYRVALDGRVDELERKLAENTAATKRVEDNTREVVDILQSWKGAMKVIEFLGKLAKPVGVLTTMVAAYAAWRSQKP